MRSPAEITSERYQLAALTVPNIDVDPISTEQTIKSSVMHSKSVALTQVVRYPVKQSDVWC